MTLNPVKTAVIGCGNISSIYLENTSKWEILDLRACANRTMSRAQSQAEKFNVPQVASIPGVYYLEAHSFWQQGRLDNMREAVEQLAGYPESSALYGRDIRLALLNGRLALSLANYREAETLLQQAVFAHQALRHTMMLHDDNDFGDNDRCPSHPNPQQHRNPQPARS